MKIDRLVGDRFKERPSDSIVDSHALMLRGGYMKYVANGIFSQYTPLRRITQKIERIIREEMEVIDGQEVLFPVVLPSSLWEESGRFDSVGSELVRIKDRNQNQLVLGMTHEEAAVQLVREYACSYTKYPFMIYQIQTKFRDEARPRAGLFRVREFTMKDAYSFHTSQEDLQVYYERCYKAYERVFARVGIPGVIPVASDSGMMGGAVSHEYMLLTPMGEDSIAICKGCGYSANMEAAESIITNTPADEDKPLTLVHTPDAHTIEEVCGLLQRSIEGSCKAVAYQKNMTDEYVIVFIRGDLEVNETKLANHLGDEVHAAVITETCGLEAGFIGPCGLNGNFTVLYDSSLQNAEDLICGANTTDYHYTGLNMSRDVAQAEYIDLAKIKDGGICPNCGKPSVSISRGIEVGHIFQLGTKYTEAMNMQYSNKDGELKYPLMGCYGIGIGRLAASVCEASHDEFGPIWPISIAPWQVHLCCVRSDDAEVKGFADSLYDKLQQDKIEVIYDDRDVRPGVMFSDADLLGVPIRVTVSPRNMREGCCEIVTRDKKINMKVPLNETLSEIKGIITRELK